MKQFPILLQRSDKDCGPTCLRIIAKYYGYDVDADKLSAGIVLTKEGTSLHDLGQSAAAIGLQTHAIKTTLEEIERKAPLPLIAHWRGIHFVVVYKISPKKVYVADPARGLTTYTKVEFKKKWANIEEGSLKYGYALLCAPTKSVPDS